MAFTHPAIALLCLTFALVGGALILAKRPFPRRLPLAAVAMAIFLLAAYFLAEATLPTGNPTLDLQHAANQYDFINPFWMVATMVLFPALACLWLLLLAPGFEVVELRWRLPLGAIIVLGGLGLWFAAAGTGLLTWLYARHAAVHVLALALALALSAPVKWLPAAQRSLMLCAAITSVAVVSYNADIFLFGRFVDRVIRAGIVDVDAPNSGWPPRLSGPYGQRSYLKWTAGPDYQRDVVVPMYDWYQVTLAFYSYFRSDRQSVLFHPLGRPGDWLPFECTVIDRTRAQPHDAADEMFLAFLRQNYCVR